MFSALFTAISSFLTSIFGLISSVFSGVVSVFWVSGTGDDAGPTIVLEALALGAAATLVGVGIYVIVRLIKGAIARTRGAANSIGR